jgi:3,4-dihydroxy 2-butanone 4-phosphate synthase/GTP cyclohydrolase II
MKKEASTNLPTRFGDFLVNIYTAEGGQECLAIIAGRINTEAKVAVRVHSACLTAEVLSSLKCDCKSQLDYALNYISEAGGVVLYLPQEGRGVGLINKIRAYSLQEKGYDTVDANRALGLPDDARTYNDAAAILSDLGINKVRLITNNPSKVSALMALGIDVCERIPLPLMSNKHSTDYLETKRKRMGHLIEIPQA